jgi:hypothetical protein
VDVFFSVTSLQAVAVPEPTTWSLLLVSLVMCGIWRCRKVRAAHAS